MTNSSAEWINEKIRDNETTAFDWELNELASELYWWVDFFNMAFFKDQPAPSPVLTFENASVNTLGHYRIGRNDWGVREQININRKYLSLPLWRKLSTLLHEMVHSWEYTYVPHEKRTKGWYHPITFRYKMLEFGIETNSKGQHIGLDPKGRFVHLLSKHGVNFDEFDSSMLFSDGIIKIDPKKGKKKGKSKLKKWSCGCTNVRVAVADFKALCLKCGEGFVLVT